MSKIVVAVLVMMTAGSLTGRGPASVAAAMPDAAKVMADMRNALGGDDNVAAIRTFTAVGTQRRMAAKGTTEGEIEFAVELPDKFLTRTTLLNLGSMSTFLTTGFNGDGAIYILDAPPDLTGAKSKAGKMALGGKSGGDAASAEDKAEATRMAVLSSKQEFARLALGLFGSSYPSFPLEFTYAAEAESPDGTAHVIEARGAGAFEVRLFVDTKTSLPLLMRWTQSYPAAKGRPTKEVLHSVYYSDFRRVGDLMFPHRLQRSQNDAATEDTTFEKIKVNAKIDAKRFAIVR